MSTPERHLVLFAKAPRIGRVKSRLARDLGGVAAWRFYRNTLAALLRRLGGRGRWRCWLAVTPDGAIGTGAIWPTGWDRIPQGAGDLGTRMGRVVRRLPPGPVVIVGSDIPDLQPDHVVQAFSALGQAEVVVGPAADGGYWLMGLRRRPRLYTPFDQVRWSTPFALADTLANLPCTGVIRLTTLEDIDTAADWERYSIRTARTQCLTRSRSM